MADSTIPDLPAKGSALITTNELETVSDDGLTSVKTTVAAVGTFTRALFTATPATIAEGGTNAATAAGARTNLGGTTVGQAYFTLTNPSAITFPRMNADNSVTALSAAAFLTAIGAGTGNGTVTSVGGTGTVNGLTLTGTVTTTGNLTLGGTLSGVSLTTQVTGVLPVANGGSGAATFSAGVLIANGTTAFTTVAAPGGTIVGNNDTQTLTNKRISPRVLLLSANSATPAINTDLYDMVIITGQTNNITSFTTNLTGTPTTGQKLWIAYTAASGTPTMAFGASFEASTIALPTGMTTTRGDSGFVWNEVTSKWRCVGVA